MSYRSTSRRRRVILWIVSLMVILSMALSLAGVLTNQRRRIRPTPTATPLPTRTPTPVP